MRRKEYLRKDLIELTDKVVKEILETKLSGHNRWERNPAWRQNFFPMLVDKLNLKVGVEIGVDRGNFSKAIMEKSKLEKLHCIDLWDNPKKMEEAEAQLRTHIDNNRVTFIKMNSDIAVDKFENNSIDFCYIDGDHSLEGIYKDLRLWIHKVKIGGILSGHDYKDGSRSHTLDWHGGHLSKKVKVIVDDFCQRYGYACRSEQSKIKNWYFVKNKECENQLRLVY